MKNYWISKIKLEVGDCLFESLSRFLDSRSQVQLEIPKQ